MRKVLRLAGSLAALWRRMIQASAQRIVAVCVLAAIDVDYDVRKIDSGALTTVDVDTPDGQNIETTFALNGLR
jgi:hypothetical protein